MQSEENNSGVFVILRNSSYKSQTHLPPLFALILRGLFQAERSRRESKASRFRYRNPLPPARFPPRILRFPLQFQCKKTKRSLYIVVDMEPVSKLSYLLEPASVVLIVTAVVVTFASALRALNYGKEMERNRDFSEASITLDRSQALMIPVASSCSLLLMFYLFSSVSQLVTAFTAFASVSSLFFCLSPYVSYVKAQFGLTDPFLSRCCSKSFTRTQGILLVVSVGIVIAWLISGHWVLNNLLGISICVAFVSHVRLPNIKICAILLVCLFLYDIFWVFFSERFFGANVMVSVATQQASNPVHTVADSLSLPGLQLITKKLELPVKIIFPRNLLGGMVPGSTAVEFMMLGLGDMYPFGAVNVALNVPCAKADPWLLTTLMEMSLKGQGHDKAS
ncbi:Signal peptide peptidase-like 1 [Asimina triloba]